MKINQSNPAARQAGITLIECLVYIAVLAVLLTVAVTAFFYCWDNHKQLRRNADDIVRVLHAGERWRADVRLATGPLQVSDQENTERLVIPVPAGQITYSFAQGELHRQAGNSAPVTVVLEHVKASRMQAEARQQVTAWRWELELLPAQRRIQMPPLFTFETVAGHSLAP